MKKLELRLEGLNCASCASKIEKFSSEIQGVDSVSLDFVTKKLKADIDESMEVDVIKSEITGIINKLEPGVVVVEDKKRTGKVSSQSSSKKIELELEGLNCASCASKIENFSKEVKGVDSASLDFVTKKLRVNILDSNESDRIKTEITGIINKLEPDVKVIDSKKKSRKSVVAEDNGSCCDGHDHSHKGHSHQEEEEEGHNHDHNIEKKDLYRIIVSAIIFVIPYLLKLEGSIRFRVYLVAYVIIGYNVIIQAFKNIKAGIPFDEYFLMTLATIGAFAIGEYPEGVAVMLFYQVGEYFQGLAVNRSRDSITSLMDIRPDYANVETEDGIQIVDPDDVSVGDIIVVKPGEKIPLDGIVIEGSSYIDTSNITGESVPRGVKEGEDIISGTVNQDGLLRIRVTKEFGESTISKILDLVENASSKKAPTEKFITRFAKYYTPVVVIIALGLGVIPPLVMGYPFKDWIYRACVFLVISCPCALVISVPLGFFGGIGGAAKQGILIKGGNYLEALTKVDTVVFDKTGTITKGTFKVSRVEVYDKYSREEVLEMAAYGEYFSNHPIGKSIVAEYAKPINQDLIKDYEDISGHGIRTSINGEKVLLGNAKLLEKNNLSYRELDSIGTLVYVGLNGVHVGTIEVADQLKDNVVEDMKKLKDMGIKETIMLSGDNQNIAEKVGSMVGLDKVYGNLLPQDKVSKFEEILNSKNGTGSKVIFVGDGVNDAPVLARSDIGVAMGGLGSDAAIEASDIVIMTDEIGKLPKALGIAKKTNRIVKQNIMLSLGVKLVVLSLGAMGVATMWEAVFADVGVSIIAILNSIRALKVED